MNRIVIGEIRGPHELELIIEKHKNRKKHDIVRVDGVVALNYCDLSQIPFMIDEVSEFFSVGHNLLKSFDNFPRTIGTTLDVQDNQITSLIGIHKKINECKGIILKGNPISEGGLGLLLIKNINHVVYEDKNMSTTPRGDLALKIIHSYVQTEGGRDCLLECQQELIDAGLDEFAIL